MSSAALASTLLGFSLLACGVGLKVAPQSENPFGAALSAVAHVGTHLVCDYIPEPIPILDSREDMGFFLESEGKKTGVEVGVQFGIFSKMVLKHWKGVSKYSLVDPWMHQDHYADTANVGQKAQESVFDKARKALKPWENKTEFLRMTSIAAAKKVPDNSVDFVYLDARHDYKAAKEDIEAWWPKVKKGGILAGHDFEDTSDFLDKKWKMDEAGNPSPMYTAPELGTKPRQAAVRAAVMEFSKSTRRQAVMTRREMEYPTWMFRK